IRLRKFIRAGEKFFAKIRLINLPFRNARKNAQQKFKRTCEFLIAGMKEIFFADYLSIYKSRIS
ncbi:hypothetical protein LJC40_06885, partial [Synergistaceae bacterium OttesenSCG-928-D05]|nr:hypothetical protein [Synergistaceae bacterium OttesenSCG-928-D05]